MGIKFLCPNGHKLNVKAYLAGKKGVCPKCGVRVRIPQQPAEANDDNDPSDEDPLASPAVAPRPAVAVPAFTAPIAVVSPPSIRPAIPVVPTGMAVAAPAVTRSVPSSPPAVVGVPAADPLLESPQANWYVRPPSGSQYGPARGDVLRKWIAEGRVSGDSLVWREGWTEWRGAGEMFPSLGLPQISVAPTAPPPPATNGVAVVADDASVEGRRAALLARHRARKQQGNGKALAAIAILAIVCIGLVAGLAFVLVNSNNTHKGDSTSRDKPAATE